MRVINILPGFVDTEGLRAVFSDERSAGVMQQYGYGDIDSIRYLRLVPLLWTPSFLFLIFINKIISEV